MQYDDLSQKQSEILDFIKQHIITKGIPPSVREICLGVDLKSTSSVHSHLNTLEKKGYIKRDGAKSRCIGIEDSQTFVNVPIINDPSDLKDASGCFSIPVSFCKVDGDYIFIPVSDENPDDPLILSKDLVLVNLNEYPSNGDRVVLLVNNKAVIKNYEASLSENFKILGVACGLFRSF